jgi:primosomal protein N' (replication factor Y)
LPYAEVSVNSPAAGRQAFSYRVPEKWNVRPGQAVLVPFGQKTLQGIVVETGRQPRFDETRPLSGIIQPATCLTPAQLATGLFISRHYLAPLFESLALWLPPGFERQPKIMLTATDNSESAQLSPSRSAILKRLTDSEPVLQSAIEKEFGLAEARRAIRYLVAAGLVERHYHLPSPRLKPRLEKHVALNVTPETATEEAGGLATRAPRQAAVLRYLIDGRGRAALAGLRRETGAGTETVKALESKGLVTIFDEESPREPRLPADVELPMPPVLTEAQSQAVNAVGEAISAAAPGKSSAFLLHGVTGSGKTEIYLNVTARALERRRQVIVLVPEIALTHQIVERFTARFPGRVAILHSRLSAGERFDQWRAIAEGRLDIVIGPRSALFAPVAEPGVIILDEEHEWAYKQQDSPPLYHARTVARQLATETGAVLLLGSATPDVETYHAATRGDYHLQELPERLTPRLNTPLPQVSLVDMRQELKEGNLSVFSRTLRAEITQSLANREQIILFYNRRGGATFIQCRDCGEVLKCRHCLLPLGYHPVEDRLVCHHCNTGYRTPETCPACGGRRIKYLGLGTQKLEEETRREFPEARVLRWDSDAARNRDAGYHIFDDFRSGRADILIGTQVVARGLDLPGVGLVGVVNADTSLNLPDFRSAERTFQLLAQVAGRAGRGEFPGRVVIQSYQPTHYAVTSAVNHDYRGFFDIELDFRRTMGYPPFGELAVITTRHPDENEAMSQAQALKRRLKEIRDRKGRTGISFIGPAPAFVPRRYGYYRFQLIIKGHDVPDFLRNTGLPSGVSIDIDPLGLS